MKKRNELADANSCLNRAGEDEYVFVLLARDAAAPIAIRAWIDERIRLGKNEPEDAQIREAAMAIVAMLAHQPNATRLDVLAALRELVAAAKEMVPTFENAIRAGCDDPETERHVLANHTTLCRLRKAIAAAES
jgi:hypothetical protein